jgi:nondiscriminating aspartyl-tRNA synthetase
MKRTHIKDLKSEVGKEINIKGFVQTIRDQGSIKFLLVRDVTGLIQVVILKSDQEAFEAASKLTHESVVSLTGNVKEEAQAPEGFEVQAKKIEILSLADPELPIPVVVEKGGEETEMTKRFDWRWIDLRKESRLRIFKVWDTLEKGFRKVFEDESFTQIYTPTFMNTASESGADVFEVDYFGKKAYLSQSPQFYKQMAMASGFEKVFMTGSVYRAEESFTTRHMTEFTGWDFEMSYVNSDENVAEILEKLLVSGLEIVKKDLGKELAGDGVEIEVPSTPFPRITFSEMKETLKKAGVKSDKEFDFSPEEERALSEIVKKEKGHEFVFITHYPVEARPFYHMRQDDDPKLTKSFDLFYRGVELSTGAQREHRPEILEKQAKEKDMDTESLTNYINFFKYGCPPHGGAGFGPARLVMKILGAPSVKEVTFLPRDVKRLTP